MLKGAVARVLPMGPWTSGGTNVRTCDDNDAGPRRILLDRPCLLCAHGENCLPGTLRGLQNQNLHSHLVHPNLPRDSNHRLRHTRPVAYHSTTGTTQGSTTVLIGPIP